jgi:hypothetical protein
MRHCGRADFEDDTRSLGPAGMTGANQRKPIMSAEIKVKLKTHGQTHASLLVSKTGDKDRSVWIRKSDIRVARWLDATTVELTLPEWLARIERLV